jgi:hypothetical protein
LKECLDRLYKIAVKPDHLRAVLFNRETVEETRAFRQIVSSYELKRGRSKHSDVRALIEPVVHRGAVRPPRSLVGKPRTRV